MKLIVIVLILVILSCVLHNHYGGALMSLVGIILICTKAGLTVETILPIIAALILVIIVLKFVRKIVAKIISISVILGIAYYLLTTLNLI